MNLRLSVLSLPLPGPLRKAALRGLWQATASGFDKDLPGAALAPAYGNAGRYRGLLEGYARFTREAAMGALERSENLPALKARLREQSRLLGSRLRRRLRLVSSAQAMRAARGLYRRIGIDFRGTPDGQVSIRRCFFQKYYSGPVCRLVSALDEGLLAGLSGASDGQGILSFRERLTEGGLRCRACFRLEGALGA
jgi:hypothetical protein